MLPSTSRSIRYAVAAAALALLPLPGCTRAAQPPSAAAGPVYGGTLLLIADGGPDHLDTVPAYYTADYILERAYARQLVSYPSVADPSAYSSGWNKDTTPAADVATVVPTIANGGVTDGGKTYTFHIRAGVDWGTVPPRQVTAWDFVREFKAFCNPAPGGFVGNLSYYSATIAGLGQYCKAETTYFADFHHHPVTAADIAGFQNTHNIAGVTAVNTRTLRFRLLRPASDFLYMLTLPFASARPVEYDKYLPNSLQLDQHTISDGPYQITYYEPGQLIVLARNPASRQSSDPLRHQYVYKIIVTVNQAIKYDLILDVPLDPGSIGRLRRDPDFHIWPGSSLAPYIVFNLRSPDARHAIAKLDVRRAIEYGIDKAAIQRVLGGAAAAPILNSVIAPGNLGHFSGNPYPDRGGRGSPAKCRALLARAGFPHGLKLVYVTINDSTNTAVFHAALVGLKRCGINLAGKMLPGSTFYSYLPDTKVTNRQGAFDLASPGWVQDWYGNSGRTFIAQLFHSDCRPGTNNYGCYQSRVVDRLIAAAETARTLKAAANFWRQANEQIMKDAAIVPLIDGQSLIYSSPRVHEAGVAHGVVYLPGIGGPDITNIWIRMRQKRNRATCCNAMGS